MGFKALKTFRLLLNGVVPAAAKCLRAAARPHVFKYHENVITKPSHRVTSRNFNLMSVQRGAALVELSLAIGTLATVCAGLLSASGVSRGRLSLAEIASISAAMTAEEPSSYITIDNLGSPHCDRLATFMQRSLSSSGFSPNEYDLSLDLLAVDIDSGIDQVKRSVLRVRLARTNMRNLIMPLREIAEAQVILRPDIAPASLGLQSIGAERACLQY